MNVRNKDFKVAPANEVLNVESDGYPAPNRYGLGWEFTSLGAGPTWIAEPDVQVIQRIAEKYISPGRQINAELLGSGAYNKVYLLSVHGGQGPELVFRIGLPVFPHYKTASEVATLEFVRKHTTVPVPRVYYYDSSSNNDLKFEWMIMDRVQGDKLEDLWSRVDMDMDARIGVVKDIAALIKQLEGIKFPAIGSLYKQCDLYGSEKERAIPVPEIDNDFLIGPCVSSHFFGPRIVYAPRDPGPYLTDRHYMHAVTAAELAGVREWVKGWKGTYQQGIDSSKSNSRWHRLY
ncbi:hypothetical protein BJ508DRAFT_215312 [Ascobolus immersus RN42]|uniref:Aminoglycoside phosphotransferase domain-containing protein n=1 Tax=Ascobolus immersus RN42 TaxID=1160509 RepID=A0A3N4HMT2_ASCIM|nr:hypothetical protein BJ508DRAFT_215312 [Ascobolus immersus RN42]